MNEKSGQNVYIVGDIKGLYLSYFDLLNKERAKLERAAHWHIHAPYNHLEPLHQMVLKDLEQRDDELLKIQSNLIILLKNCGVRVDEK